MHQLLIIDDQSILADDLADMLPWGDIGIDVVHKAYSGREALELMYEHSIDVVVTDIRMPGMSGLELITEIRRNFKHVKCIMLTGYADFEYTKQALQLKSSDYLLKPVEDGELMEAVRRALNELEREWQEISSLQHAMYTLSEQLPKLREYLLLDLISGKQAAVSVSLEAKLKRYEIPFRPGSPCRLMLIRIDSQLASPSEGTRDTASPALSSGHSARLAGHGPEIPLTGDEALIQYAVTNMAAELFGDRMLLWSCTDGSGFIVCLSCPKNLQDAGQDDVEIEWDTWMESQAFQLQHAAKSYLKTAISVLTSKSGMFPYDVASMYQSSLASFRHFIGREPELFVSLAKEPQRGELQLLGELYRTPTLVSLLEMGQWEAAEKKLEFIFQELEEAWRGSPEHVIETYFGIASSLAALIHRNKKWLADTIGGDFYAAVSSPPINSAAELRSWTERVIAGYRRSVSHLEKDSRSTMIRRVQGFIEQNLDTASLQTISASVYLNPSYLSKIYKLETGEGISEYILRVRMEKAAVLLSQSPDKIYEISVMLGYQKPSYFIQLFKKHFGVTPQEYRNKLGV